MKRTITLLLVIAISGCSVPAFADEVAVAYAAPAVEDFGTGGFSAAWAFGEADEPETVRLAMFRAKAAAAGIGAETDAAASASPLTVSGGSGRDWQLGVDPRAASETADREGWPWYGKALLIGGCVIVAGLATWAIVEACDGGGSHSSSDSSQTVRADVGGQNNSVTIHYHSPSTTHAGGRMDGEDAP